MKPKRFNFRTTSIFGAPLKCGVPLFIGFTVLISGLDAHAGDILRGGSAGTNKPGRASAGAPTPAATDAARANAKDTLARTTRTLDAVRAMQNAARNAAIKNGTNHLGKNPNNLTVTLPKVPNGLITGGLVTTTDPTKWTGAKLPTQTVKNGKTEITIKQTTQQALLNWQSFNVGKKTTVTFDQSKGGADVSKWIAFNKITDPTGNPTQILGNINADGQVYLINANGIIFGGSSQVNARGLTASSLPINENLINQGLLNNRDDQFLFSGLSVPGGADGTPNFKPELPPASTGKFGDVTVQKGAILKSPTDSGGSGGRIMLVGPNVTNNGTISTESGQTILAAGLQVGVAAHNGSDPSLRGLDVWVGDVGTYGGTATNSGIIEAYTGSTWMAGKNVNQLGAIDSTTSVSLNGRIDLKASYGAVANPNFDSTSATGSGGPRFLNQFTGTVTMGEGSSARILPDYLSKKAVPGIALPERSQINIEGLAVHFDKDSSLFAPNAEVVVRAGSWPYKDADGDRTIFANGLVEAGLALNFSGTTQKFFYDKGQIYIDEAATINVAGSVDVFVPLAQSILTVELRGNELADSPLQRDSVDASGVPRVRGVPLTVDIRNTGVYNGKYWIGTPLGDVTGLAGLIERNAAQLTAVGGNISMHAGESIVLRKSSSLDVSGGFLKHEAGPANTSFLIKGGRLVAIKDATPDQQYDGVFNGSSTFTNQKWGVSNTFDTPLFGGLNGESFVEGAAGGTLTLTAPSMVLDGEMRGATVSGPRQRSTPAIGSVIKISFEAEKSVGTPGSPPIGYVNHSPTPPEISFSTGKANGSTPGFTLVDGAPVALPDERVDTVVLSTSLLGDEGFGSLEVYNPVGAIIVPEEVTLAAAPKGSITLAGSNITILGSVIAPGGKLSFTTYNISPSEAVGFEGSAGTVPFPIAAADRGMFILGKGASLSAAGLVADDREFSTSPVNEPTVTGGGEIFIRSFNADLRAKSVIDVSGGVFVSDKNSKAYGKGGRISIITGSDAGFQGVIGGTLNLHSKLRGYSGTTGGSLSLQASLIQVGGSESAGVLNLPKSFFREGGFVSYSLTGIGAKSASPPPAGHLESYIPAISIAAGARIRPLAESLIAEVNPGNPGEIRLTRFVNEDGLRSPVSLGFTGLGSDDPFTIDSLEVRGDIVVEKGASIRTEPGASVSFKAGTVTLLGEVIVRGGKISVAGAGTFPLTGTQRLLAEHALPTVHLGVFARLSVAGVVQLTPDAFGRRTGKVFDGGTITVTGNIIAEKGSLLDASGTSGILDLKPSSLSSGNAIPVASTGGLTSTPFAVTGVPTRIDSAGGTISVTGSEMLASDATLLGAAGGSTALGGTLLISSGVFNFNNAPRTSADTNLIISQNGDVIRDSGSGVGVGIALTDTTGTPYGDLGLFSLEHFREGSFSSLGLNGNIEFQGPVNLVVPGSLRLAAGGVIHATDTVSIRASYISVGQDFRAPENPDDVFVPFNQQPTIPTPDYFFPPTFGSGKLSLSANLIDLGTLSLQNIGKVDLTTKGGDIRGNGTLSVAGDVTLTASNIYPTSLASFDIFAYDHASGTGSVTIKTSGKSDEIPISAGGNLAIYASTISQDGILRAPLGSITLGWDGTDLDPSDADIDSPYNIIAGATISSPVTGKLTLGNGSLTSVSAATEKGKPGWIAPFGISPDGQTWIDPRGVNVTLNGLPEKSVSIKGEDVDMDSGAVVDVRGGGELFGTRWLQGLGGSMDLLGSASSAWGGSTEYQAGDLVTFGGVTWSARVRNTGQSPVAGPSWSKLPESYAIIPTSGISVVPFNTFNTGSNAGLLSGDPGFVNSNLKVGATITLDGSEGLPAGTYTLLPARYALLSGAYLVTAVAEGGSGTVTKSDGASIVSGYVGNRFNETQGAPLERLRFEIASAKVVATRVDYDTYTATEFLGGIADKQGVSNPQQLPGDAGYAAFHGNSILRLAGSLLTKSPGIGARVDVSSFADIHLSDSGSASSVGGSVVLNTSVLTSWGAESLLIGGLRRERDGVTTLDVRTGSLTLDNAATGLTASDVVLASKGLLEVAAGSSITAAVDSKYSAAAMSVSGDGTLLRVSADADALTRRDGQTGAADALMKIGESAEISGESVVLDSTYGSELASDLKLAAEVLTLGSGQISVLLDGAPGTLAGSVVSPHLVLSGNTLADAFSSRELTLRSYRSIDIYGTGQMGGADLAKLTLTGSGVRGYGQAGGDVVIRASEVNFDNSIQAGSPGVLGDKSGSLTVNADRIRLGANAISVNGYQNLALNAAAGLTVQGVGTFSTTANLNVSSPLVSGEARTSYSIISSGAMVLDAGSGTAVPGEALGARLTLQAASIKANTDILLPSGELTLRATDGPLEIGGNLSVAGSFRKFGDLIRYSDAGTITLESVTGDVKVLPGAEVSVSASDAGGNAGTLSVRASQGVFANSGSLHGDPGAVALGSQAATSGRFLLDVGSLAATGTASLGQIGKLLDGGGFHAARNFRIRNGDVTIDNLNRSHEFALSADRGSILVNGTINASGQTGGSISLAAHGDLTLVSGSELNAGAVHFNSAGKGGSILLEVGTQLEGVANTGALLDLQSGSQIYLGVKDYVAGDYKTAGSSAFEGKFTGTLHLRAPRTAANNDVRVDSIESTILGASSVVVEGFNVYTPANGVLNIAQRNLIHTDAIGFLGAAGVGNANEAAMRGKLLTGAAAGLDSLLVLAPGVEIINRTGDLTLGLANPTGSTSAEALSSADWDLSGFRYGSRGAAGVLTLRAQGNLVFNNTLSDGFNPITGTAQVFADNGHSRMWLGTLMKISDNLPVNTQSWSYRLTAGADTNSGNSGSVLSASELDLLQPGKGSVIVGEFYPAVPNNTTTGLGAGVGVIGQTADSIRISTTTVDRGNRFEVVRTGTGGIAISAGRDVQLRNQFSTIYTAGVALPDPATIFSTGDFVLPTLPTSLTRHPGQSVTGTLGAIQQLYPATWSMAGGNISLSAGANIGRYTLVNGILTADSTRQMPTNWLYRRGYVDTATGLFASNGGFGESTNINNASNINDAATSTTWWIDYSNFFQGIGTLGGGDIVLTAGNDIVNVDAVTPTNARMAGRWKNPDFGIVPDAPEYLNLAPDADNLLELGGGDVTVTAGRNIDGGIYYVERGKGILNAGGEITTNQARALSPGILNNSSPRDSLTWLPTTLFVGKSTFDVTARGDILLGPVTNPFLLPQGINNKYWYKTYFNTFSENAGANILSLGGDITHRTEATPNEGSSADSILKLWFTNHNLYTGNSSAVNSSNFQPWLRLAELDLGTFGTVFKLFAPNLRSTALGGDVHLVGDITLSPSATGDIELAASGGIIGLNPTGEGRLDGGRVQVWTASNVNLSDAAPEAIPGIANPLGYQLVAGRDQAAHFESGINILGEVSRALNESGSYTGEAGTQRTKTALHDGDILHAADRLPVTLYATTGDITGLTLFSPKKARILAGRDISDVSLYLQNLKKDDITLVSAGRDILPFNETSEVRSQADNLALGNTVGDSPQATVTGGTSKATAGDIRISGPGVLEVVSGRNLDLGTGSNFSDGTGTGISSIGNLRNPFLPFSGAEIIALAGVTASAGDGPADGLADSSMDIAGFISKYLTDFKKSESAYWMSIGGNDFEDLTDEQQAIVALGEFYQILRDAGRAAAKTGSYKPGYQAVKALFGKGGVGDIFTRSREIRTTSGGGISVGVPDGGITMASEIVGNPLTPPGIVTEFGGSISTFTHRDVNLGQARIFTLRGGDIIMWSSKGNIAAGSSPRTVVTAPPTRVVFDISSASVQTDLGGLATGGGIGVLAAVEGVEPGKVGIYAPQGYVDAGDAGIRATGDIEIGAQMVLNSGNISSGGTTTGSAPASVSAPSVSAVTGASNASAATGVASVAAANNPAPPEVKPVEESLSLITVEVIGYGGGGAADEEEDEEERRRKAAEAAEAQ